jgi:predicted nucleic acid-binding protein
MPDALRASKAERIIAATALHLGCPLVTRDRKIQAFNGITTI